MCLLRNILLKSYLVLTYFNKSNTTLKSWLCALLIVSNTSTLNPAILVLNWAIKLTAYPGDANLVNISIVSEVAKPDDLLINTICANCYLLFLNDTKILLGI